MVKQFGSQEYKNPGMFQYDYPDRISHEAFQAQRKPDAVSSSFKPEFRIADYYALPQGQSLQQHLLRMGFKFRDIPETSTPVDDPPQFRPQPARGRSGYQWSSDDSSARPAPIFRPLGNVDLKKSETVSVRGITLLPTVPATVRTVGLQHRVT